MASPWEEAPIVDVAPAASSAPARGLDRPPAAAPWESAPAVQQAAPQPQAAQPVAPAREVGGIETALRTVGLAAAPVMRMIDMAAASLAGALGGQGEQDRMFGIMEERQRGLRDAYAPKPGEEMSLPGQIVGGIASVPMEIVGGFGAQRGLDRAAEVVERGGTMGDAALAGGVSGAANVAANLVPVKAGGAVGRGLEGIISRALPARVAPAAGAVAGGASGGLLGAGADVGVTAAENTALPQGEQFEDLRREADLGVSGGLGAALGAVAGARGARAARGMRGPGAEAPAGATPGTKGSAGAAGTDVAAQRRERARSLPVPFEGDAALTEGQATRSFEAQRFERETAKDPDLGAKLRERAAEQNAVALRNLDALEEFTGAQKAERGAAGQAVVDAISEKAQRAKKDISQAYDAARDAGDMSEPIDARPLAQWIEDNRSSAGNAGVIGTAEAELLRLGGAEKAGDGTLVPREITINDLEELRKKIVAGGKKDATNAHFAGEINRVIDRATDGRGGELYQAARAKYRAYQGEFKERGVIRDLIGIKKGTSDRITATEKVLERAMRSADDLRNVHETLVSAGDGGVQAWREVQGMAMRKLRDEVTKGVATDIRGNPIVSPAKLKRTIDTWDQGGQLDVLLGKKGAETLRDLRDAGQDLFTAPPGAVNTSNTASVIAKWMADSAASFVATGVPAPLIGLTKAAWKVRSDRKVKKQIEHALGPKEVPAPRREPGANPFEGTDRRPDETKATGTEAPDGETRPAPRETPADADPRLQEIERLKQGASVETVRVLDEQAKKVERELRAQKAAKAREAEVLALEKAAGDTTNPDIRAALVKRANELRAEKIPAGDAKELAEVPTAPAEKVRGKLPVGEAKELPPIEGDGRAPEIAALPVGEATEVTRSGVEPVPSIPVGEAKELFVGAPGAAWPQQAGLAPPLRRLPVGEAREVPITPATVRAVENLASLAEREAGWRQMFRFGDLDAGAAKSAGQAIRYDPDAVDRVMAQHERSPRVFEREIARIIEEGKARESKSEEAGRGGQGLEQDRGRAEGAASTGTRGSGAGRTSPTRAERSAADGAGRQAEDGVGRSAAEKAADYLATRDDVAPAVRDRIVARYKIAERVKPKFDAGMHMALRAMGRNGREVKLADIKKPDRATEKILVDYDGEADRIKDLVRGTLVIRDIGSATDAVASLQKRFGKLIGLRNALAADAPPVSVDGYRDIKANVMIDGQLAEVQVNVPEMIAAKKEAHPLYERIEEIKRRLQRDDRDATPDEAHEWADLERRQQAIYAAAWDAALRRSASAATSLRNAASDTSVPLRSADEAENRRGSEPSTSQARYANSGERVTGTSSTSRNKVPSGKESGSFIATTSSPILRDNPIGRETIATTERGVEIPVRYRLVDVSQLITSHDDALKPDPRFPAELQPRDRSRQSSEAQIARIENNLNPELLAESAKASDGAPIIGADGVVESGNARTIALRRAYAANKAARYRAWLIDNAGRFGLSADEARKFRKPVLVREGLQPYDRADFARQANESAVSAMSETEMAQADAKQLPDLEGLVTNDDGSVNLSRSAEFIRDFMRMAVGPNERNALMTSDGRLSQRGIARVRNAVFAKAYGDAEIVSMLTEATDSNVKNVLGGLLRAAREVARLRELIDAGARPQVDFVPDLVEAVRRFAGAREEGMTVQQALAQGDLMGGEASARVATLMREIETHARAPRRLAEMLRRLVEEIDGQGDPRQAGMFAEPQE